MLAEDPGIMSKTGDQLVALLNLIVQVVGTIAAIVALYWQRADRKSAQNGLGQPFPIAQALPEKGRRVRNIMPPLPPRPETLKRWGVERRKLLKTVLGTEPFVLAFGLGPLEAVGVVLAVVQGFGINAFAIRLLRNHSYATSTVIWYVLFGAFAMIACSILIPDTAYPYDAILCVHILSALVLVLSAFLLKYREWRRDR